MTTPDPSSTGLRSATEFPQEIEDLDRSEANKLYSELRDTLICVNRSRGQLLQQNDEHKQSAEELEEKVEHLQTLVDSWESEKKALTKANKSTVAELEREREGRGQLLQQNEEYQQSIQKLEKKLEHLQSLIDGLESEKKALTQANPPIASELERDISLMRGQLSTAIYPIAELDTWLL